MTKIKTSNTFHDRFLIIDDEELYHIGASLKELEKRVFAFSKMDINSLDYNTSFESIGAI